jgi:hypothetical protein
MRGELQFYGSPVSFLLETVADGTKTPGVFFKKFLISVFSYFNDLHLKPQSYASFSAVFCLTFHKGLCSGVRLT